MTDLADVDPVDPVTVDGPPDPPSPDAKDLHGAEEPEEGAPDEAVPAAAASVRGFTVLDYGSPLLGTFLIPGTAVRLSLRREIAPLLIAATRDFHREVEELRPGWCWGFAHRRIEGSSRWSSHAIGCAVDLNAPRHPMGRRDTFAPAQRTAIRRILARYVYRGQQIFRWGGDFRSRPDDMHFEINVRRDVALAALGAMPKPPKPGSGHRPGTRVLRVTSPLMRGDDVAWLQRWAGRRQVGDPDGRYGPQTAAGMKVFQQRQGLTVDGVTGPATWSKILGRTIRL